MRGAASQSDRRGKIGQCRGALGNRIDDLQTPDQSLRAGQGTLLPRAGRLDDRSRLLDALLAPRWAALACSGGVRPPARELGV